MKIIHISDIHIGAKLGRHSQNPDIKKALSHINARCAAESADLLLIAGDIFDSYNPSGESEDIYYNFLDSISAAGTAIAIIAGNHDNHERLCAPAGFLKRHNIMISVNNPQNDYHPFELEIKGEKISIAPIAYVYDGQVIDTAEPGSEMEAAAAYSAAYSGVIKAAAAKCGATLKILMAHAFFAGAINCGSERNIQRGNTLLADASDFSGDFKYCAFGHLHRCQKIAENAYYSGSIIPVSIDEARHPKKMILIDTVKTAADGGIKLIDIPEFSVYKNITGDFEKVYPEIAILQNAYISLVFTEALNLERQDLILKTARDNGIKIVSQAFDIKTLRGAGDIDALEMSRLSIPSLFDEYLKASGNEDETLSIKFGEIISRCEIITETEKGGCE